ncbi:uncharacterized protein V6R79_006512 [Siganus canaliculatus]
MTREDGVELSTRARRHRGAMRLRPVWKQLFCQCTSCYSGDQFEQMYQIVKATGAGCMLCP